MAVNLKRLVYFDSFMDPIANTIIGRRDDIDLVRLDYNAPQPDNWTEITPATRSSRAASFGNHGSAMPRCWRAVPTCWRSAPPAPATT